jgi:hypothetical protein
MREAFCKKNFSMSSHQRICPIGFSSKKKCQITYAMKEEKIIYALNFNGKESVTLLFMHRVIFILLIVFLFSSCGKKTTCPAYMNGSVTGTEGSREKPHDLFPKDMTKKKKH